MMDFTYKSYIELLELLEKYGYEFASYHDYSEKGKCVILRHDVDESIGKALKFALLEQARGISSTYFILMTSDFYNVASAKSREMLSEIIAAKHEIGLHFDETAYDLSDDPQAIIHKIREEAERLSELTGVTVSTVSMHRPSEKTLEADLKIPGMINSYGREFFKEFKYISDSRRNWREPVEDIIRNGEYNRLHILTHAFWYGDAEQSLEDTLKRFINEAVKDRYESLGDNISDFESIVHASFLKGYDL